VTCKKDVSTLRLAVGAIAGPIRVCQSDYAVVIIAAAISIAVAIAIEAQSKVPCGFGILEHSLCCGHMDGEWAGIVSAASSDYI